MGVWRPFSLGQGANSGSGMVKWEGAKITNVGRSPFGHGAHSARGGRSRLGVGHIYISREFTRSGVVHVQGVEAVFFLGVGHIFMSQKFAENSRRLPNGRGARSGHGLGVMHILGLGSALRKGVGRSPCGCDAHSGRGGRSRLEVGHLSNSHNFVGNSRRLLEGHGAYSRHGSSSCSGVVDILGLRWWNKRR